MFDQSTGLKKTSKNTTTDNFYKHPYKFKGAEKEIYLNKGSIIKWLISKYNIYFYLNVLRPHGSF